MRVVERRRRGLDDMQGTLGSDGVLDGRRVDAVDELHADPEAPVIDAAVVDRDDVRVLQLRGEVGLALEPGTNLGVGEQLRVQ